MALLNQNNSFLPLLYCTPVLLYYCTNTLLLQYPPELYPGRRGSMAPWSLRLLLAELPSYNSKQVAAMNRLFRLRRAVRWGGGGGCVGIKW